MKKNERSQARNFMSSAKFIALLFILGYLPACYSAEKKLLNSDKHTLALWKMDNIRNGKVKDATNNNNNGRLYGPTLTKDARFGKACGHGLIGHTLHSPLHNHKLLWIAAPDRRDLPRR